MRYVKLLFSWYSRQWKYIFLLIMLVPLVALVNVHTQVRLGAVVDAVSVWRHLLSAAGMYGVMIVLQTALSQAKKALQQALNYRMTSDLRERIVYKILKVKPALLEGYSEGELLQLWNQDVKDVQQFSVEAAVTFAISCVSALLALIELGKINLFLPIISVMLNALTLIPLNMLGKQNKNASGKLRVAQTAMNETFYGIFDCIRVIKAFGKEEQEVKRFMRSNDNYIECKMNAFVTTRLFKSIVSAINSIAPIVIILLANNKSLANEFSVGSVVAAIALFSTVNQPFISAGNLFVGFKSIGYKIEALQRLYDLREESGDGINYIPQMDIELRDVDYSTKERKILSNINLDIQDGEKIAIVGESGSGKSTLCKLLAQILSPTNGTILLNKMNLTDYSLDEYRKRIYYSQSNVYFPFHTIMDNLRMYGASENEVLKLAGDMGMYDDIAKISDGFFSELMANSANLSGGQVKKIEVLRAMSIPRMMYIFDEITSGMDRKSADKVMDYLVKKVKSTVVSVMHDVDYAKLMDKVVVMENGYVVDVGSHESLLERCTVYKELIEKAKKIKMKEG